MLIIHYNKPIDYERGVCELNMDSKLENLDLLQRIQVKQSEFSKGQKRLAAYIIDNYDRAAFLTASKLGKEASVSESTVVRFAYQLGYDGYPELQQAIKVVVRTQSNSIQRMESVLEQVDENNLLPSILQFDGKKLKDTLDNCNEEEFNKALDMILKAKHIYILGVRSSGFLAGILGHYFNMIFDNIRVVESGGMLDTLEQIYRIEKEDVFIGISFPRYSKRAVETLAYAKKQGAKTIAITDSMQSPLTLYGTCNLIAKSDVIGIVDSLVAPLSLINALVVGSCLKKRDDVYTRLSDLERLWEEYDVYDTVESMQKKEGYPHG